MQQFGLAEIPAETGLDPDRDGFTNLEEFVADTDPASSTDRVRILQIVRQGLDSDYGRAGVINPGPGQTFI